MQIIRNLSHIKSQSPLVLTIGNFDGAHLGHLKIISEVKKIAKEKGFASAILTFEPHPVSFFRADFSKDFRISSLSQKLKIFREQQIDYAIILPFNQKISEISAADFVKEILLKKLNSKHLVIGYDFTFGKNRQGNFKLLEDFSKDLNFELTEISALKNQDQTVSSSHIRRLINAGNVREANNFLGKNFTVCGLVNEGKKLASQLSFATANLKTKPHLIKPKFGVYKSSTFVPHLGKKFTSITNFGIKPTISEGLSPLFETHIFDFSENLYNKKIYVELLDFIREEKKFDSIEQLKLQIEKDCISAYSHSIVPGGLEVKS